jgi:hypothetical protein
MSSWPAALEVLQYEFVFQCLLQCVSRDAAGRVYMWVFMRLTRPVFHPAVFRCTFLHCILANGLQDADNELSYPAGCKAR